MGRLAEQIVQGVKHGVLQEPFRSSDLRKLFPGWAKATYGRLLARRAVGASSRRPPIFIRLSRGLYRVKPDRGIEALWESVPV